MKYFYILYFIFFLCQSTLAQRHLKKLESVCEYKAETNNCADCCCTPDTAVDCFDKNGTFFKDHIKIIPKDIIYDFKTGIFTLPLHYNKLKLGDAVRVRILHFNPLLFGVSINSKDSSVKAVVDANNLLTYVTNPSNLSGLVAGLGSGVTTPGTIPPPPNRVLAGGHDTTNNSAVQIQHLINLLQTTYDTILLNEQGARLSEHRLEEEFHEYSQQLNVLRQRYPTCEDFAKVSSPAFRADLEEYFRRTRHHVDERMDDIQARGFRYVLATQPFAGAIATGPFHQADSLLKQYFNASYAYLSKVDSNLSYKYLDSLLLPLYSLKDMKPCFTSGTMIFTKDIKTITLQFKPWTDSAHNYVTNPDPIQLPMVAQKAWGVSAGIYVSTLHNQEYTSQQDVADTNYHLIREKYGKVEIGVDALAYLGLKTWPVNPESTNYNYVGLNYGAGLSLESKPKPRVLLGLGYVYGGTNRVVISLGFIAGYVDHLSNAYSTSSAYAAAQSGFIKQVISPGAYFSINYSFLGN